MNLQEDTFTAKTLSIGWGLNGYQFKSNCILDGTGFQTFQTLDTLEIAAVGVGVFNIHRAFGIAATAVYAPIFIYLQA